MGETELERCLKQNGVWHRFIQKPETVHTADAAKVAGVELFRLTKNLVSETEEGEYVLLVVPGDRKVDLKAAARALGVSWVRLVPFGQAEKISGYPPGATPSVGHKTGMRTVVDGILLKYETIYCGGGSRDRILEFKPETIMKLSNAVVADISKPS